MEKPDFHNKKAPKRRRNLDAECEIHRLVVEIQSSLCKIMKNLDNEKRALNAAKGIKNNISKLEESIKVLHLQKKE